MMNVCTQHGGDVKAAGLQTWIVLMMGTTNEPVIYLTMPVLPQARPPDTYRLPQCLLPICASSCLKWGSRPGHRELSSSKLAPETIEVLSND